MGRDTALRRPYLIDRRAKRADIRRMLISYKPSIFKVAVAVGFTAALALSPLGVLQAHEHENDKDDASTGEKTVTGEVVDLMCYIDHNASGDKHAACAEKCIKGGGPVGITSAGRAYLIVGEHKAINDVLAEYAGKTITVKGKIAERDGMAMIENAEIVKN